MNARSAIAVTSVPHPWPNHRNGILGWTSEERMTTTQPSLKASNPMECEGAEAGVPGTPEFFL
jgi:hypothetical protein